jgi:mersacidin/lichenicidin family type 2 lantibiotic
MKFDITRAWKDEDYRLSLSAEQLSAVPTHPAGEELSDTDLEAVFGGSSDYEHGASSNTVLVCEIVIYTANIGVMLNLLTGGPTGNCAGS